MRFPEIQVAGPAELRIALVTTGGYALEQELHRAFAPFRTRGLLQIEGEWRIAFKLNY